MRTNSTETRIVDICDRCKQKVLRVVNGAEVPDPRPPNWWRIVGEQMYFSTREQKDRSIQRFQKTICDDCGEELSLWLTEGPDRSRPETPVNAPAQEAEEAGDT